jgi:hypothetical protein
MTLIVERILNEGQNIVRFTIKEKTKQILLFIFRTKLLRLNVITHYSTSINVNNLPNY